MKHNYVLQNLNLPTPTNGYLTRKLTKSSQTTFGKPHAYPMQQLHKLSNFNMPKYMGNHWDNVLWPLTHPNPNCTFYPNYEINTWPQSLSTCTHPHIIGLCIGRHNKAVHQTTHKLQLNKHTRCYTLVNVAN